MKVAKLMSPDLPVCRPGARLDEVAWRMWAENVHVMAVVERGKLVGILSDRDVASRARRPGTRVRAVMASPAPACRPEDDVDRALELMVRRNLRRLPVVDGRNRPVGILSIASACLRRPVGIRRRRALVS